MTIVYDWPLVTKAGPIDAAHIAPWAHLQTAGADRLVAVPGNPITGRFSGRLTVKAGDQPQSSSGWRSEVYSGGNGKGFIPLDALAFHGWAFTLRAFPTDAWFNVGGQLHGAVDKKQPCFQSKIDHGGGLYVKVNWPGGGSWERKLLDRAVPGMLVMIAFGLRPSLGSTGLVSVEWAIDDGDWSDLDASGKPLTYSGPIGFAATYPKGTAYGEAGGGNTPWVVDLHRTVVNAASMDEVIDLLTPIDVPADPGGGGDPGPPPSGGPTQAQLDQAIAERDAARAIALDLKGRIDRMVSIGQTGQ